MKDEPRSPRFLTLEQVADELQVTQSAIRTLIKTGELRGIQIGGRGLWRVGRQDVEDYIAQAYRLTAERVVTGDIRDDQRSETESRMADDSSIRAAVKEACRDEGAQAVADKLLDLMAPGAAGLWLQGSEGHLGGAQPIVVLQLEGSPPVIAALSAIEEGALS